MPGRPCRKMNVKSGKKWHVKTRHDMKWKNRCIPDPGRCPLKRNGCRKIHGHPNDPCRPFYPFPIRNGVMSKVFIRMPGIRIFQKSSPKCGRMPIPKKNKSLLIKNFGYDKIINSSCRNGNVKMKKNFVSNAKNEKMKPCRPSVMGKCRYDPTNNYPIIRIKVIGVVRAVIIIRLLRSTQLRGCHRRPTTVSVSVGPRPLG
mmetsp:Transcript_35912/g.41028  ORF Transcript_35912/g.41028 Transcript_35912/m.41028 type:complete len:201 (-) Transcript_35912:1245-1847(-)